METSKMNSNGGNGHSIDLETLTKHEGDIAALRTALEAHTQLDEVRFEVMTGHIGDLKETLVAKLDQLTSQVAGNNDVIRELKAVDDKRKRRQAFVAKAMWAGVGVVGVQLITWGLGWLLP